MIKLLVSIFVFSYFLQLTSQHCDLLIDDRVECGYPGISKVECEDRNCCWIPFSVDDLRNPPWCSAPASNYCGYKMISVGLLKDRCNKTRTANITVERVYEDVLRVEIVRSSGDFQVPHHIYPNHKNKVNESHSKLRFEPFEDKYGNFNFKVIRNDTEEIIWNTDLNNDTSSSSIQMKLLYTQIGGYLLSNHSIYGLGYHAGKLKIEPGSRLALFARDAPTSENQNLYSTHTFYLQIQNGKAHGVVRINANLSV